MASIHDEHSYIGIATMLLFVRTVVKVKKTKRRTKLTSHIPRSTDGMSASMSTNLPVSSEIVYHTQSAKGTSLKSKDKTCSERLTKNVCCKDGIRKVSMAFSNIKQKHVRVIVHQMILVHPEACWQLDDGQ